MRPARKRLLHQCWPVAGSGSGGTKSVSSGTSCFLFALVAFLTARLSRGRNLRWFGRHLRRRGSELTGQNPSSKRGGNERRECSSEHCSESQRSPANRQELAPRSPDLWRAWTHRDDTVPAFASCSSPSHAPRGAGPPVAAGVTSGTRRGAGGGGGSARGKIAAAGAPCIHGTSQLSRRSPAARVGAWDPHVGSLKAAHRPDRAGSHRIVTNPSPLGCGACCGCRVGPRRQASRLTLLGPWREGALGLMLRTS
jgi:hypothetical protein